MVDEEVVVPGASATAVNVEQRVAVAALGAEPDVGPVFLPETSFHTRPTAAEI
jgi:hypothetical protein